ncbi:MAG: hypothetical protein CSB33_03545 [Desulfobacterales bacterium]|nr:MAG: hypothetical protein CSB33_03545 [Desulfobacterales bacterium]
MMPPRIWILNLMVAGAVLLCSVSAVGIWSRPVVLPSAGAVPPLKMPPVVSSALRRPLPSRTVFSVISDRNLFSPDRRSPAVTTDGQAAPTSVEKVEDVKIDGRRISLYGVVLAPNRRQALISSPEPGATPRDQVWIREGDTLGKMTVVRVHPDGMILADGAKRMEIQIHDPKKKRNGPPEERRGKSDISHQPKDWAKSREKPQPPDAPAARESSAAASGEGTDIHSPPLTSFSSAAKKAPAAEEFVIIKTPFGEIKRRKK